MDNDPIFCCPCASITPLGFIRSMDQLELWKFAWLSASHPSHSQTSSVSLLKPRFQCSLLRKARFCIQFEKWVDGDKCTERYFTPNPCKESSTAYVEMEKDVVVREQFASNWEYIKLRCGCTKQSIFFLLKFLKAPLAREQRCLNRMRSGKRQDKNSGCQSGGTGGSGGVRSDGELKRKRDLSEGERGAADGEPNENTTSAKRISGKKSAGDLDDCSRLGKEKVDC